MSIIFGPINSRRFGRSLGVDLSPNTKQCNFDCLYCELKAANPVKKYEEIVSLEEIKKAINQALQKYAPIDYLTITANGEPTLYPYLKELILYIKSIQKGFKTLILSNASTIDKKEVQEALTFFDEVKLSLDCVTQKCFKKIDRAKDINIETIKTGMLEFAKKYHGKLIIEILFVEGINDKIDEIKELNTFLKEVKPHLITLGTIDRPPAYNVKAVAPDKLFELKSFFDKDLNVAIVTKGAKNSKKYHYTKENILQTIKRRPLSQEDVTILFDEASLNSLYELLREQKIELKNSFYILKEEL